VYRQVGLRHINWGLGWCSLGGRDWVGTLSLLHTRLREVGRGCGNGGGAKGVAMLNVLESVCMSKRGLRVDEEGE